MPVSYRWLLPAFCIIALGLFAVCSARSPRMVEATDPPRDSPSVTVYDPNPKHLWNRLYEALYVRLDGEGPDDPGELDPFLWDHSRTGKWARGTNAPWPCWTSSSPNGARS
jgi:hypothetical protein